MNVDYDSTADLRGVKIGRPRVDDRPDFYERFALLLPALRAGYMSRGEAARRLGISRRSLGRYLRAAESQPQQ